MRANRYLHIAIIIATLISFVLCQTASAGRHKRPCNRGLPSCLAKVSKLKYKVLKLKYIFVNQQETIDQQEARIEVLEAMLENFVAVQQSGQTNSYAAGDDGDLQIGVQWPNPRFTDNGDGTVTDNLTGLIWLKNTDCFGSKIWDDALDVSNNLADGQCGLTDGSVSGDWRLPNIRELQSLVDYGKPAPSLPSGHPFTGVQSRLYSSSTTQAGNPDSAWFVDMQNGVVPMVGKVSDGSYVWPVRGGND